MPIVEARKEQARRAPKIALKPRTLRCVVYRSSPDAYIGECIDLDLMVQAKTPEKASESLQKSMIGYLKVVLQNQDQIEGLIPRSSPVSHRLRYHLFRLRAALSRGRSNFLLYDCSPEQLTSHC